MKNEIELSKAVVVKESDKAICVAVTAENISTSFKKNIWLPKTQCRVADGKVFVSEWILLQKENEIDGRIETEAPLCQSANVPKIQPFC